MLFVTTGVRPMAQNVRKKEAVLLSKLRHMQDRFNWLYETFGRAYDEINREFNGCVFFIGGKCHWQMG